MGHSKKKKSTKNNRRGGGSGSNAFMAVASDALSRDEAEAARVREELDAALAAGAVLPEPPIVRVNDLKTYKKVIEDAVQQYPDSFIKFKISTQIRRPGYNKIRDEINRSNGVNGRFDQIENARPNIDRTPLPGMMG